MILAFLSTLACASPMATPTPDYYAAYVQEMASNWRLKKALTETGAWIVTATATARPTPNAEATCVAKGHRWDKDTECIIAPECSVAPIVRCRRCGLWRELQ